MPQPVNLNRKPAAPAAPTAASAGQFKVPPPATMPPGITSGTPPLPPGRVVKLINPAHLTPDERKALQRVGWTEGQPIPESIAGAIQKLEAEAQAEVAAGKQQYAIDPATPPLKFEPVPIEQLPMADQARYNKVVEDALAGVVESATPEPPKESILDKNLRTIDTGPAPALQRPASAFVAPDQPPKAAVNPKIRAAETGTLTAPPPPEQAAMENRTSEPIAPMTNCPHCRWNLSQPDEPEPNVEDKQTFLQSVLGEIQYVREYEILGGAVTLTLRTLTTREIDACFQQCFRERDSGKIQTEADFFERLNRFRLYLQLQRMRSRQFDHDLPDGLNDIAAPNATCHWELDPDQPPLEQIEQFMLSTVIKTESINRVVQQQANRFNRLVARLEALTENSDFWKATAVAS